MNSDTGRIWLLPEYATVDVIDAPIFARLYDHYFPLRLVSGATAERLPTPMER